jgi:hypothetical protein
MSSEPPVELACVVVAHADPQHVRRLVNALDPFPVFLHCDARTPPDVFERMTVDLPARVRVLPRHVTPWATWGIVAAEIAGYRAVLDDTQSSHLAVLSGSDYPLAPTQEIRRVLEAHRGRSILQWARLPIPDWGRSGGMARLRYRHRVVGKRMLRLPVPRRLPPDLVPAGGPAMKIVARGHVRRLVDVVDSRPDLVEFWRSSWIPDETFVPTVLSSPAVSPDWLDETVNEMAWHIQWAPKLKSPPYLTVRDLPRIVAARRGSDGEFPRLFARKFASAVDTDVLDVIDATLRATPGEGTAA